MTEYPGARALPAPRASGPDDSAAPGSWLIVGLLTAAVIVSYSDRLVLNLMIGPIREDLLISDTQFSVLQGVSFGLVNAVANPALAWLSDRTSRRWILIIAMLLWGIATIGCGLASQYGSMIGARALLGLGEAALLPAAFALICERFAPSRRDGPLGVLFTGLGLSAGIGVLIGGVLLRSATTGVLSPLVALSSLPPWRLVFVLMGLPPFVIAAALVFALRSTDTESAVPRKAAPIDPPSARLPLAPLVWGYIAAAAYLIALWAEESWIPAVLIRRHGFDAATAGSIFGLATIGSGLISPIVGLRASTSLRARYGARGPYLAAAASLTLALPAAICLLCTGTTAVVAAALVLDTAIMISAFSFISSLQDLVAPRHLALGLAVVYFVSGAVGASIGPSLVALATDRLYGIEAAVDQSLVTVLIPALTISIVSFLTGVWILRRRTAA